MIATLQSRLRMQVAGAVLGDRPPLLCDGTGAQPRADIQSAPTPGVSLGLPRFHRAALRSRLPRRVGITLNVIDTDWFSRAVEDGSLTELMSRPGSKHCALRDAEEMDRSSTWPGPPWRKMRMQGRQGDGVAAMSPQLKGSRHARAIRSRDNKEQVLEASWTSD